MKRWARPLAIVVLAVVTLYGVRQLTTGDWGAVRDFWSDRLWILPVVLLFSIIDAALEGVGWMWVYSRFGIPIWNMEGVASYLAGRAGMLLPAQLGRLIRPDSASRLEKAPMRQCLKAEAFAFVLDSASVMALLAALVAYKVHPLLAPVAVLAVIGAAAGLGDWVATRVLHTPLGVSPTRWWHWKTAAIVVIQMAGWVAYGLGLWVMVMGLPSVLNLWDVLFYSAGASVVGVGTGLPGGIGATELLLGVSLGVGEVAQEHLVVIIGAFRVLTLWIWIPVGWLALGWVQRKISRNAEETAAELRTSEAG